MKKKNLLIILIIVLIIIILFYVVLKNVKLGYNEVNIIYEGENKSQTIKLGVPKLSFLEEENENNYSYKNVRGNKVLMSEVKSFLNTLSKIECNNTTYYYDKENNFTIINYSVKNYGLYNNVSYEIRKGNYCFSKKISEYTKKLGGIRKYHVLEDRIYLSPDKEFTSRLHVYFLDDIDIKNEKFTATMTAEYLSQVPNAWNRITRKELEKSTGVYEIKNDKLYYTRTNIEKKSEDIVIPKTSVFKIEDQKLILEDKYLSNYENNIILK